MTVTTSWLANLRAVEAAGFRFQPGLNPIVGFNGAGKTGVSDAAGARAPSAVKHAARPRGRREGSRALSPDLQTSGQSNQRFRRMTS